ncbi:hypothetical protein HBI56_122210 [Parastagonospora nodorum]|uniref:Uncharacterized protein n=1 Tax=Phaeosphaeria nodorum (strain SN15 / ATCC MYA-4574 / FGSC 10173) TaxID=321614 RepID=A0A7U2FDD7_PHANO|nr:hypothetical protein HBH56_052490 [Parastagonospora nodorum]QRD02184.1 hypothetical protein JI435_417650 [Parastagonospora nodorum SN15]KAH3935533.1 hypothetical protein HBH54_038290 [Parastagonospora nodorum]KAH3948494.1 hypothetical protein HBH53_100890 [Parastagonospora nodorum]KAH3969953.1 hypothetical protein HBH51_118280 [Parastagonospora nodorum]
MMLLLELRRHGGRENLSCAGGCTMSGRCIGTQLVLPRANFPCCHDLRDILSQLCFEYERTLSSAVALPSDVVVPLLWSCARNAAGFLSRLI